MYSEKTTNLTMHKWGPKDPMNLLEWNENFQKIGDHSKKVTQLLAETASYVIEAKGNGVADDTDKLQKH